MKVLPGESRTHLIFDSSDFIKGLVLKPDMLGEPGIVRLEGLKQKRVGGLGYRGGATEYPIINPVDFHRIQGHKKWYRKDGGYTWLFMADRDGGSTGLFEVQPPSGNLNFLQNITQTEYDVEAPVTWENCDNLIIALLDGMTDRPYCTYLTGQGIGVRKLGLTKPSDNFSITEKHTVGDPDGLDFVGVGGVLNVYKWCYTYLYGTKESPALYGESAPGLIRTFAGTGANGFSSAKLDNIAVPPVGVVKIRIYRTLVNATTFYRVGEIDAGRTFFEDKTKDASVDLSHVLPIYQGLPGPMRVARWIGGRLWWFGVDGRLHVSAAGTPDINPANFYVDPGNIGFRGNWIGEIRGNIYVGKEDGIFLIQGSVPNLGWKKIDGTRCFSRSSFVEMQDGLYFLGENNLDGLAVYLFNGNYAQSISTPVKELIESSPLLYKKCFAAKVHDEYWLSLPSSRIGPNPTDGEFVSSALPFNNLVLCYKAGGWSTERLQASSIDVFDGPGDRGEIYYTESDSLYTPQSDKGKLFRFDPYSEFLPNSTLVSGVHTYTKNSGVFSKIAIGPIFGYPNNFDSSKLHKIVVNIRGCGYVAGLLRIYDANTGAGIYKFLESSESDTFDTPEEDYANLTLYSLLGNFNTILGQINLLPIPLIRQEFSPVDTFDRLGYIIEYFLTASETGSSLFEIEGIEVIVDNTVSEE